MEHYSDIELLKMNTEEARSELFNRYKPLIYKSARQYSSIAPVEELVQEGSLGFTAALNKFQIDPNKNEEALNNIFKSFVKKYVIGYIRWHKYSNQNTIEVTPNALDILKKFERQDKPLNEYIKQINKKEQNILLHALQTYQVSYFKDIQIEKSTVNTINLVPDESIHIEEDITHIEDIQEQMESIYSILIMYPQIQQQIFIYKYGLFGCPEMSIKQIANKLGIQYTYVTQTTRTILNDLKECLSNEKQ